MRTPVDTLTQCLQMTYYNPQSSKQRHHCVLAGGAHEARARPRGGAERRRQNPGRLCLQKGGGRAAHEPLRLLGAGARAPLRRRQGAGLQLHVLLCILVQLACNCASYLWLSRCIFSYAAAQASIRCCYCRWVLAEHVSRIMHISAINVQGQLRRMHRPAADGRHHRPRRVHQRCRSRARIGRRIGLGLKGRRDAAACEALSRFVAHAAGGGCCFSGAAAAQLRLS